MYLMLPVQLQKWALAQGIWPGSPDCLSLWEGGVWGQHCELLLNSNTLLQIIYLSLHLLMFLCNRAFSCAIRSIVPHNSADHWVQAQHNTALIEIETTKYEGLLILHSDLSTTGYKYNGNWIWNLAPQWNRSVYKQQFKDFQHESKNLKTKTHLYSWWKYVHLPQLQHLSWSVVPVCLLSAMY